MNRIYNGYDNNIALLLAQASLNAYDTSSDPPAIAGYGFVQWLWGRNPDFLNGGDDEKYVAIYRQNNTNNYIFAFKGTASWEDLLEDIKGLIESWAPFPFYDNNISVKNEIAQGFSQIYTTPTNKEQQKSLQQQLFEFLKTTQIQKIYITGHSLGSALAEIFTVDLCYAIKNNIIGRKELIHYNFACPAVGNEFFYQLYNRDPRVKGMCNIIRFVNFCDEIPCFSQSVESSYCHISDYYLFRFQESDAWAPHYENRHSITNYFYILRILLKSDTKKGKITINDVAYDFSIPDDNMVECKGTCFLIQNKPVI